MPNNIDDIISREIQTLEDRISEDFCACGDELSEHYTGFLTGTVKCYGMNYNGTVWSSCKCSTLNVIPFKIVVEVYSNANNSPNNTNYSTKNI